LLASKKRSAGFVRYVRYPKAARDVRCPSALRTGYCHHRGYTFPRCEIESIDSTAASPRIHACTSARAEAAAAYIGVGARLIPGRLAKYDDAASTAQEALMPTARTAAHSRTSTRRGTSRTPDAIALLKADHKKVKGLFRQFKKVKKSGEGDKAALVAEICAELRTHAQIEEEIFYPAVRAQIDDADLMDEALVEHAGAKDLIAQLESMSPGDDLYDAKVTVLGEEIDHHVKEEEGSMFPKAKRAKVDTKMLGEELAERKSAITNGQAAPSRSARSGSQ
jgi:hemerythrin superfamily protein